MANSIAENYFEKYTGLDAANQLTAIPTTLPRTYEDEHLDFKAGFIRETDFDALWSKELGAFANNAGGVIVFGIKADRDNEKKLDYAHALSLVANVEALKNKLNLKYRYLTDPPLPLVNIKTVATDLKGEKGFVICYIPEGKQKPYRSTQALKPYYIRIGDGAVEIPHSILRHLFYPHIQNRASIQINTTRLGRIAFQFSLSLRNDGPNSIRDGIMAIKTKTANLGTDSKMMNDKLIFHTLINRTVVPGLPYLYSFCGRGEPGKHDILFVLFQSDHAEKIAGLQVDFQNGKFFSKEQELPETFTLTLELHQGY